MLQPDLDPGSPHPPALARPWQITAMGVGLVLLALVLAYLFLSLWPSNFGPDTVGGTPERITFLATAITFDVTADVRLLMVVMLAGGLGSFVHTATSFGDFVGNRSFSASWAWWYILKPLIGMVLAVVFYLIVRGGLLSAGAGLGKLNVYGIVALAAMAGMFAKQATDKLSEVFDTVFRTRPGDGDSKRKDALEPTAPAAPPRAD